MASFNSYDSNCTQNPGDDPSRLRFVSELFGVPERTFAYLALGHLGWSPAKFVADCRDLTLKDLEKLFEQHLIRRGYSRGLVRHVFQRLRKLLRKPPARDRPPGDERPLGLYKLHEFFTLHAEEDVLNWCRAAEGILQAARERALLGDARFEQFWAANQKEFTRTLHYFVRNSHVSAEDIAHSTWLAIQIGHDTGATWDFPALRRIALSIYDHELPRPGLDFVFLDELAVEVDPEDAAPGWRIPDYVHIALLETLFDSACLPCEVMNFFCRWILRLPPRVIVASYARRRLFDLSSEIFAAYLPKTTAPEAEIRKWFALFDARLCRTVKQLADKNPRLETSRPLLKARLGWTRLKDYFKARSAPGQAVEVGRWWAIVLSHLENQAATPDTPLFVALHRWGNEARREGRDDSPDFPTRFPRFPEG